jgi:anti-sigma regulatory factor (Ser/Thr protein kinase)
MDDFAGRLPAPALEDARLLLSELITNAVNRAGESDPGLVSVLVRASQSDLLVEVEELERPATDTWSAAPMITMGWGMLLVHRIADAWGVDESARRLWFRLEWESPAR